MLKRYKPWLKRLLEVGVMYSANSPLAPLVQLMVLFYQDAFRMLSPVRIKRFMDLIMLISIFHFLIVLMAAMILLLISIKISKN